MIPEIEARDILLTYNGSNNQILEWKIKFENTSNFKLTRPQAEYVIKYHKTPPRVAKKYVRIVPNFGEKLMSTKYLTIVPEKIWCEKLLCESDMAYHMWGGVTEDDKKHAFWVPKTSIIQEEKNLNREVDYTPYSHRPPLQHQKIAVEKLLANDKFILADDMGTGKGQTNDTIVYNELGVKKIGELVVGDKVIGSDGKPYNVIGVHPRGKKETFKITFNDGFSIVTDDEHLWSVSSSNYGDIKKIEKSLVLSTRQMFEGGEIMVKDGNIEYAIETYYKTPNNHDKWQIPIVRPIQFENNNELPIEPYSLGLFLCGKLKLKPDLIKLQQQNIFIDNKRVPEVYKYSSVENRVRIIQGLMDANGFISKKGTNQYVQFSTLSEKLCDDFCEIIQTLGGIAEKKLKRNSHKKGNETTTSYRVTLSLPKEINPFRLKRKRGDHIESTENPIGRYISKIEKHGEDYCTCISVDSPDKLYVTEHCIVTHNTTSTIIAALESGAKKILIICPATLKINWQREIENYTNRRSLIVEGKKWGSTFDFYIINYDIVKNFHTIDSPPIGEVKNSQILDEKFDLAIVDESHMISNTTAQRTKLINDILKNIPKVWLLTGTPMTSRPINFFNLLKIVNSNVALNWQSYVKRYCGGYQFKMNGKKIWKTSGATNLDELRLRTKSVILRRLKTDILDLPDKIISPIFLELNSNFYTEELEEFIKITNENKNKESLSVSINRLMKVRQIIAQEKIPHTCEIIDRCLEQEKKVIVFTNFTSTLDMLKERYPKISVVLDGRMNKTKRQESVDKFQTNDKVKIFISNIVAGGVGITLTEAEVVIMNDLSFVPAHHSQAEDRSFRHGQKKNVLVYYPIFENTIEKIVYNILNKKKNIIDQVMGDGEYSESFVSSLFKELL
jgi:hypothetical protein